MTLRARLASITTALLATVLAVAGVVLERVTAADVDHTLETRARERARGNPSDGPERPTAARSAGDPTAMAGGMGDGPPDAMDDGDPPPPPPDDPHGEPDAPPPPQAPPPTDPAMTRTNEAAAPRVEAPRVLLPESDGAAVEFFQFQPANALSTAGPTLRFHGTNGEPRLTEADARARLVGKRPPAFERVTLGTTTWYVAQDLTPPVDAEGRRVTEAALRPPAGPRRDRRPPAPPPLRRVISVAFVDSGPAMKSHRALVWQMGAIGLGAVVVGGLLAYALAGRMLRPVATAARAAESIHAAKDRLPAPATRDELGRLVAVLNGMLERLEAASDREKLFLATASHELRRPLTALLGELEMASAAGRRPEELRASIALARDDGKAMSRLVDDILHHARSQAGTLPLVETEVSLPDLVSLACARSRRSVPGPFDLAVDVVPDMVVRADADLLRRALENLVVNAAVHGGDGVHVFVRAESDASSVRLHVDDDGPGVPQDEMKTIFDPFGRGDRARTVPGFGLGLAIARDVARAHGGDLTVVSPCPGADAARPGSRFTLSLAAARALA